MSKIHYFQRYSSYENTVTNNTLQLLARIYNYSIAKLDEFLNDLLGDDVGVGIEIFQQKRGKKSVPDGFVLQRSFKIVVESKVDSGVDVGQLVEHCAAFDDEKRKILILLTKKKIEESFFAEIQKKIDEKGKAIIFKNVTYEDICNSLIGLFKDYEYEITDIVEDYQSYCRDTQLIDETDFIMRVVPTGGSFDMNKKHGIYFQPYDRPYSQHTYIGFYRWKAIRSIMKVNSVIDVRYENGQLAKTFVYGKNTDIYDKHITEIIKEAVEQCHWQVQTGHRFFCAGQLFDTDLKKISPGGIRGARIFNLKSFGITDFTDTAKIAEILKTKTWE